MKHALKHGGIERSGEALMAARNCAGSCQTYSDAEHKMWATLRTRFCGPANTRISLFDSGAMTVHRSKGGGKAHPNCATLVAGDN